MILSKLLNMQMMMFLLIGIGFLIRKRGIVGAEGRKNMVDVCIYITLPFNIFQAFLIKFEWSMMKRCGVILATSIAYHALAIVLANVLYRKEEPQRRKPLQYGTLVSNAGFMGNPVIEGLYGAEGLFYTSFYMIPVRIVMWTVGVSYFLADKKENILKRVITHPCIIATLLGITVLVAQPSLPLFIKQTVSSLSSSNTPLCMMLVGMMIAEMNPKGFIDKTMIGYTVLRLLIIPGIVLISTGLLRIDPMIRGIAVVLAGMPSAVATGLLSSKYGCDEKYATAMIFVTTVGSLITLPLLCSFL